MSCFDDTLARLSNEIDNLGLSGALKGGEPLGDHASKFALTAASYPGGGRALMQRACT